MSNFYGNFSASQIVRIEFNTVNASGVPTSLSSGSIAVLKAGAVVSPSGGVTLTPDAGSVVGYNTVVIDLSVDTTTFTAANDYSVRLAGSSNVGGTSVLGIVVGEFSIANRSAASVTGSVGSVTGAVGSVTGSVGSVTGNLGGSVGSVTGAVGSVTGSVGSVTGAVGSVAANVNLNFAQTLPGSPTIGTVGNALAGAEAQAGGKWTLVSNTLTVYRGDNSTVYRVFTLDSGTNPTQRV